MPTPQPGVIIEWFGPYPLTIDEVNRVVRDEEDGFGNGAQLLCMALGDGGAPYRCSIGHWKHDANQGFPLDIPEGLAGAQCYLGTVVSYFPEPGRIAAAWALLRVLQPGRRLANPANPEKGIPERLEELQLLSPSRYCMSVRSWFHNQENELTDPPPGFPVVVTCNQYDGNNDWFVWPQRDQKWTPGIGQCDK